MLFAVDVKAIRVAALTVRELLSGEVWIYICYLVPLSRVCDLHLPFARAPSFFRSLTYDPSEQEWIQPATAVYPRWRRFIQWVPHFFPCRCSFVLLKKFRLFLPSAVIPACPHERKESNKNVNTRSRMLSAFASRNNSSISNLFRRKESQQGHYWFSNHT